MPDDAIEARKKAMDLLARREHARTELERKLAAAGFDADVTADALHQLSQEGLQSDRRFVESYVQSRINQGKGPLRIHADLAQRGIAAGLVDEVLAEIHHDWHAAARDARAKKFGQAQPADFKDKARQMRFLQYRGFEPDQVRAAVSPFDE
jgi:regulatory protein